MAGLVPAIHVFKSAHPKDVDARHEAGHDDQRNQMPKSLAHKIALVTGASRGIGRATAIALAREGAHIVALARTVGGLEELDDEIKKAGSSATLVPLDLRDFDALDRLGASLHERFKKLDLLAGNAGPLRPLSPPRALRPTNW